MQRRKRLYQVIAIGLGVWFIILSPYGPSGSLLALCDLTVTSLTAPPSASRGSNISVIATTKNLGPSIAPATTQKIHLCTSSNANNGCTWTNHAMVGLAVGSSKTVTGHWVVPVSQPLGTNYIIDIPDGLLVILEANESNNTNSLMIIINP